MSCILTAPSFQAVQINFIRGIAARGGGGVLDISLGGEVRRGPRTLTLFKTNIADFPTLIKTKNDKFDTLFKTPSRPGNWTLFNSISFP